MGSTGEPRGRNPARARISAPTSSQPEPPVATVEAGDEPPQPREVNPPVASVCRPGPPVGRLRRLDLDGLKVTRRDPAAHGPHAHPEARSDRGDGHPKRVNGTGRRGQS